MTPPSPSSGRITSGITPNTFVEKTLKFIEDQLPEWRDDKTRPVVEAEEDLNGQLCKYLNDRARENFPMAYFHHEEKQGKRRRVDMSVLPSTKAIEAALYDSIYVPFLVIEGKRLPAPGSGREREYVTGMAESSGGIQRFRLCLHGRLLKSAVMVAYVQQGKINEWLKTINDWISDLEATKVDSSCSWSSSDHLGTISGGGKKAARCQSICTAPQPVV